MIQFIIAGAKLLGAFGQADAVKRKAQYEAALLRNQGLQAKYDAEAHAAAALFNKKQELRNQTIQRRKLKSEGKNLKADTMSSYISRGLDPSAAMNSAALQEERTFQEMGYATASLQGSLTHEARLQQFYGDRAQKIKEFEAQQAIAEGRAASRNIKTKAFISLAGDAYSGFSSRTPKTPTPTEELSTSIFGKSGKSYSLYRGGGSGMLGTERF